MYSFWCTSVFFATPAYEIHTTGLRESTQRFRIFCGSNVMKILMLGEIRPGDAKGTKTPWIWCFEAFHVIDLSRSPWTMTGRRTRTNSLWDSFFLSLRTRMPRQCKACLEWEKTTKSIKSNWEDGTKRNIHFLNMGAMTITIVAKRNHGYPSLKLTYPQGTNKYIYISHQTGSWENHPLKFAKR